MMLNDHQESSALFSDAEIDWFLSEGGGDLNFGAGIGWRSKAAKYADLAKNKEAGNYKEDLTKMAGVAIKMAESYEKRASEAEPAHEIIELGQDDQAFADFVYNEALRGNL